MLLIAAAVALAGEGMWLPEQLPSLEAELAEAGFALPAAALSDPLQPPMSSVVGLGFCSASFVSPLGLVFTNLHCADGWISLNSTGEHNWLEEGFTAPSRAQELPAGPGARLWVLEQVEDVTGRIQAAAFGPGVKDEDRKRAVDHERSEIVARCERAVGRHCRVAVFDGGASYRLVTSLEIKDVRIVHNPPESAGFFGGDLDNFEWPRHDADYTLLRAYVGKDGKPAPYREDNVPYQPRTWLPIDPTGAQEGEPAMAIGYPGSTNRTALPEELRFEAKIIVPDTLSEVDEVHAILTEEAARSDEARAHLQAPLLSLENDRKYARGIRDNLSATTLLEDKMRLGARVDAAVSGDPAKKAAVDELRATVLAEQARYVREHTVRTFLWLDLLSVAHKAVRWADERPKKDLEREPGLQTRDRERIEAGWADLEETLWLPSEKRLWELVLAKYLAGTQRISTLDAWLERMGGPEGATRALFDRPPLASQAERIALLASSREEMAASSDPWVQLAIALEVGLFAEGRQAGRIAEGVELRTRPVWVDALRDVQGGRAYPDANGTLRLTFGRVEGYAPRDGLQATPRTRVAGLVAKDRLDAYEAPKWLLDAAPTASDSRWADDALRDVPINFVTSLDTTGGNSGSATLNAEGKLIGLVFDGNYESMSADWQFDPGTTRTIHVDVRYILWLLSLDPKAAWILAELGMT
ncbi:MAG: S46 family peptidase [Deltaproteobacteria bacterium]|nr:S46 family peptidase [Deltaproteobacteria bacterium]